MENTSQITAFVGRDKIREAFGVKDRVVALYIQKNEFPASWFDALEFMCQQDLPRHLFSFKGRID